MIGKGPPSTVGDVRELFVAIRNAFPSIVRGSLPWLGISFYSKGFHSVVRELFRPCAPCVWIWVWSCLVFWFSRWFLENQKNLRENQKYKRKPKKTNKNIRNNQNKQVFKGFRPTLGYGFVFFVCLVFPKVFTKPKNHSRKPKKQRKPKKTNKNLRENQKNKVFKSFRPTLGSGFVCFFCFCLVFPKVCFVFFCMFGFLYLFILFCKNLRENQKTKKTNPYPRVGLKP